MKNSSCKSKILRNNFEKQDFETKFARKIEWRPFWKKNIKTVITYNNICLWIYAYAKSQSIWRFTDCRTKFGQKKEWWKCYEIDTEFIINIMHQTLVRLKVSLNLENNHFWFYICPKITFRQCIKTTQPINNLLLVKNMY